MSKYFVEEETEGTIIFLTKGLFTKQPCTALTITI